MSNFRINRKKIPQVIKEQEWQIDDEGKETIYRIGEWSMSEHDDADIEYAENAVYAWMAWYEYLTAEDS